MRCALLVTDNVPLVDRSPDRAVDSNVLRNVALLPLRFRFAASDVGVDLVSSTIAFSFTSHFEGGNMTFDFGFVESRIGDLVFEDLNGCAVASVAHSLDLSVVVCLAQRRRATGRRAADRRRHGEAL